MQKGKRSYIKDIAHDKNTGSFEVTIHLYYVTLWLTWTNLKSDPQKNDLAIANQII